MSFYEATKPEIAYQSKVFTVFIGILARSTNHSVGITDVWFNDVRKVVGRNDINFRAPRALVFMWQRSVRSMSMMITRTTAIVC